MGGVRIYTKRLGGEDDDDDDDDGNGCYKLKKNQNVDFLEKKFFYEAFEREYYSLPFENSNLTIRPYSTIPGIDHGKYTNIRILTQRQIRTHNKVKVRIGA